MNKNDNLSFLLTQVDIMNDDNIKLENLRDNDNINNKILNVGCLFILRFLSLFQNQNKKRRKNFLIFELDLNIYIYNLYKL